MTREQWRLARQIADIITAEAGASMEELAERTGASYIEARAAARILYRMRRADYCWSFLTAVPPAAEGRRTA